MKKKMAPITSTLLVSLTLGLAACGQSSGGAQPGTPANEVDMGLNTFVQTGVTIGMGQSVHFVDQQSGMMHILCIGKDGQCDARANGPRDLTGRGFTIQPGQSYDVRFDTAGRYSITCTIHPNMNLTVTVH